MSSFFSLSHSIFMYLSPCLVTLSFLMSLFHTISHLLYFLCSSQTPDGLAVDWLNRNLYWSDSHTSRMEVATLDGRHRMSLSIDELFKPRGLSVDPTMGYLYWADWGTSPFIARIELDGKGWYHIHYTLYSTSVTSKDTYLYERKGPD